MTVRTLAVFTALALGLLAVVALANSASSAHAAGEVTIDFSTSSTHAARHPDLRVVIENHSAGDITSATMSLPTGFMGSLNATPDGTDAGTEPDKCPWIDDAADFAANCTGELRTNAKIGTVKNIAHLDNTANDNSTILDGSVYLTERNPAHTEDAAGMVIVVDAKVSNLDLGRVVVPARLKLRSWVSPDYPNSPAYENVQSPVGVDAIVENIPTSITDPDHGAIDFTIDKIVMDVMGDPPGGATPMIVSPSDCTQIDDNVKASFTTTDAGAPTVDATDTYTPDDCTEVDFAPVVSTFSLSNMAANGYVGTATIGLTFPEGSSTVRAAQVDMPKSLIAVTSALVPCGSSVEDDGATVLVADPQAACADRSNLGTAVATSPLLATPVVGDVIAEAGLGTLPNVYIVFKDPSIGLDARIRGRTDVVTIPADTGGTGDAVAGDFLRIRMNLEVDDSQVDLPSLPLSSLTITMQTEPTGNPLPDGQTSVGPVLRVNNASGCMPQDAAKFSFTSWSGQSYQTTGPQLNFTGCPRNYVQVTAGPASGSTVGTDEVMFTVKNNTASAQVIRCSIDDLSLNVNCPSFGTVAAGDSVNRTVSGLSDGVHKFLIQGSLPSVDQDMRVFTVDADVDPTPDTVDPTVTIDSGPADPTPTSDTTPTFAFSGTDDTTAAADIEYQCSLDGKAFQPCGSGASGSFTPSAPLTLATSEWSPNHSFAVRSEDEWGNVSTSDSANFTIEVPFSPAVSVTPTTTTARSHPTMEVNIGNDATEDIQTFNFKMPNGFLGSLLGAPAQCSLAQADAAACPAGSQIGTVEATAQIDQSEATLPGKVYLTDPMQAGDPASIAVVIDSQLGDLDLQRDVVVKARLAVRGNAEGVDAFSEVMPRTAHDNVKNVDITFRARHIKMTLSGNNAGTQPFLWTSSDCSAGQKYVADLKSYDSDTSQTEVPYTNTGCDALPFTPKLNISIAKPGSGGPPAAGDRFEMTANMIGSPLDAGIKFAQVTLPKTMTVDFTQVPANICEAPQIATHTCPAESLAGTATVNTPLLATPLSGPVYMARNLGKAVPNLSVQLTGLISIDLFGQSRFVNETQIQTDFANIPDAPMTSFTMHIDHMLKAHSEACTVPIEDRAIKGHASSFNGKTSVLDTPPIGVDCKDDISIQSNFKNKGAKSTLTTTIKARGLHSKIKRVQLKLPKGMKINKKAIKKKVVVTGDGRKLKPNCWKLKNASTLDVTLCGKQYGEVKVSFKAGSLTATKKVKGSAKPTLKVTSADGKVETLTPPLSVKSYPAK